MMLAAKTLLGLALVAILACDGGSNAAPPPTSATAAITDRDWELIALGEQSDPVGAGGKPVTLRFDSASKRAAGFAGCNRYSGSYELAGDKLTFGPAMSTRMACEQGMDVEDAYLMALGKISSWEFADDVLTLRGVGGTVLRFRAAAP